MTTRREFIKLAIGSAAVAAMPATMALQAIEETPTLNEFDLDVWIAKKIKEMEKGWDRALDEILLKGIV